MPKIISKIWQRYEDKKALDYVLENNQGKVALNRFREIESPLDNL